MKTTHPITQQEVLDLVKTWFKYQVEQAPIVDIINLVSENYKMCFDNKVIYQGYRGVETHQLESKKNFFDQIMDLVSIQINIHTTEAVAKIEMHWDARHWNPGDAKSERIKAIFYMTWKFTRCSKTQKIVMCWSNVDHMKYIEGFAPKVTKQLIDPHLVKEY